MGLGSYTELNAYKERIRGLWESTEACHQELGQVYYQYTYASAEGLKNLLGKLNQANFKVIVIGKFSTGKSSLINTLLGEFVLPDSLSPCTAYINEIVYGEEKQATIYFKHPLPERWADFVQNESVKEHIQKHIDGRIPEFVIPLEDLADCVTIPWNEDEDDVFEDNTELDISPFAKAVIQYPCELCRNGIEIIDSPGLDEARDRTEIVDKYLKKVDAVIYVMTNIATGGDSDKEIIKHYLVDNDIKNVFFVCNLFGIPLKMAQKQLFGRLKKVFADKSLLGERGIHLVNIRDLQNTGVAAFEAALADYLNNEKGLAQLNSYVETLQKLNAGIKSGAAAFEHISDVNLRNVNAEIAALKQLIAEDQTIYQSAAENIASIKTAIEEYCKRETMEHFKKLSYAIRSDIRDRNDSAAELTNAATTAEADALAEALAKEYTVRLDKDYVAHLYQELTVALAEEVQDKVDLLQQQMNAFMDHMEAAALEGNDLQKLSPVEQTIAQGFAPSLKVEFGDKISFEALNLAAILGDIVKKVFQVYASYQNANRGAKLTAELQNQVTVDVYKKLERVKRPVVEYTIAQAIAALESLLFSKLTSAMTVEIKQQQDNLAAKEELRLAILEKQKEEHSRSAAALEQLGENLLQLAVLDKELNA